MMCRVGRRTCGRVGCLRAWLTPGVKARLMEWGEQMSKSSSSSSSSVLDAGGGRHLARLCPVTTKEHLVNASAKRSKGKTAVSASASMSGGDPDGSATHAVHELRERIRIHGLPPNSVVQVLNDADDDAW
jgi:hypothetical protein